nr:regulatory protein RecX [Erythrobacter sp. THAF29]
MSSPGGNDQVGSQSGAKRRSRGRKKANPLDETTLRDLALSYAARFATTGAKLESYLARKIRERGVAEDEDGRTRDLDVPALVARLIELGYVNDDAYARMKSRDLTARGYGARRVDQALYAAGVDEHVREDHKPGEAESRAAATLLARKRRFGPFGERQPAGDAPESRKRREKQVAAMLRAGHLYDHVRFILDASSIGMIEEWVDEAREEDGDHGNF